jgi:hypothetical protein
MNFIIDFSPFKKNKKKYDAILVIIDYFTKMGLYILTRKNLEAIDLTDFIINKVTIRIRFSKSIVSDREPIFISLF